MSSLIRIFVLFFLIFAQPGFSKPQQLSLEADFLKWAEFGIQGIKHMDTRSDMFRELGLKLFEMGRKNEALIALDSAVQTLKDKRDSIGTTWPLLQKIVKGYAKVGAFDKAENLASKILEPGNQAKSQITIVRALLKKRRFQDREIMARMRSAKSRKQRMQILQEGMENVYMKKAQVFIPKIRDRRTQALAMEEWIKDLLESGETDEVQVVLSRLKALEEGVRYPPDKAFLLLLLSRTSGRINARKEEAMRFRALKIISSLKDPVQRVRLFLEALGDSYISREDSIKELKRLEVSCTKIPYEDIRSVVLGELSRKYTALDDEKGAFRVVDKIWEIRKTVKETILHDLIMLQTIGVLIDLDRVGNCLRWVEKIRNPNRKDKALQRMVPEYARADNLKKSLEMAATIKRAAYGLAALTHSAINMADRSPSEDEAKQLKTAILSSRTQE
jgi:hypothetical protein